MLCGEEGSLGGRGWPAADGTELFGVAIPSLTDEEIREIECLRIARHRVSEG